MKFFSECGPNICAIKKDTIAILKLPMTHGYTCFHNFVDKNWKPMELMIVGNIYIGTVLARILATISVK